MEEQKNAPGPAEADASKDSGDPDRSAASADSGQKGQEDGPGKPSGGIQRPETMLDKLRRIVRRAHTG